MTSPGTPSPPAACPQCGAPLPAQGFAGLCPRCVSASLNSLWAEDQPPEPDPPPAFRDWQILGPLGTGGQGIVWRAVRLHDDLPGALKVFRSSPENLLEAAARSESEAAALRSLAHPCIVNVLDSGPCSDGRFCIVTELVEGCDLHHLLKAGPLPVPRALHIASCLLSALSHAHHHHIIHRDVKPANVFTSPDQTVKLGDFSLALANNRPVTITRDGTAFGTPYYLAPESLLGKPPTPAADLYAVGVLLYEMLTGAPPAGRFAKLSSKCHLPPEADTLVESLLAEDPSRRPPSADAASAMLDRLKSAIANSASRARRRSRSLLAITTATGALLAAAAGYLIPKPSSPPPPPPPLNHLGFPNPLAATASSPFLNSLGMSFVPIPQLNGLLFSRFETRMDDWITYSNATNGPEGLVWQEISGTSGIVRAPLLIVTPSGWSDPRPQNPWPDPGFSPPENAPAWGINCQMARRFCSWLTWREQQEGRISRDQFYRLPSDAEWSTAAGLPPEPASSPGDRHMALPANEPRFPWGPDWPPPANFANYAGREARDPSWPSLWLSLKLRKDNFPRLAPVGSFPPNANGLHDLWGNVWEWCDDRISPLSAEYVQRGGSWVDGGYDVQLRRDFRQRFNQGYRSTMTGFRCVLVIGR
jgi:serine/threonine protein kinase